MVFDAKKFKILFNERCVINMAELLKGTLRTLGLYRNPLLELDTKEHEAYVDPATVQLRYRGRELTPTQFDAHGNPQIGGMMREVLLWENRQLLREGRGTGSTTTLEVEYGYRVSQDPIEIPITLRLPKGGVCPICGQPITLEQLDDVAPGTAHPEYYYDGLGPVRAVAFVEGAGMQPVAAHNECYEMYHTMRWTDGVMTAMENSILNVPVDQEDRLHWGKGEKGVQFEEIPSKDLTKNSYVRKPWFRFRAPFGSFEVQGEQFFTRIVLLPDFPEFDLERLKPDANVIAEGNNRIIRCGFNPASVETALAFLRNAVWPPKSPEELFAEWQTKQKVQQPARRSSFFHSLFKRS